MKKFFAVIMITFMAFLGLFTACDTSGSNASLGGTVTTSSKYTFTQAPTMETEYTEYLGYSAEIVGILKNTSSRDWSYASVEFSVYDSEGNNLGTALDNINNLKSGDTWKFSASFFDFSETQPTRFELADVTYW